MCRPAQVNCDVQSQSLQKRAVRFQSYVQEVRYCCGSPRNPKGSSRLAEFHTCASSWRAARTLGGTMYYYNYSSDETCWERPVKSGTEVATAVGDDVEIFCELSHSWRPGYVEKIRNAEISVAFQMLGATAEAWVRRELYAGHKDLRGSAGKCLPELPPADSTRVNAVRPTYEDTELPRNWTLEEQDAYSQFWRDATDGVEDSTDAHKLIEFFMRSGLKQHAVDEIWQVANPDLKPSLGAEEFRVCCRLMAHCQALTNECGDPYMARALKKGGQRLRSMLRCQCLPMPPPRLPNFFQ